MAWFALGGAGYVPLASGGADWGMSVGWGWGLSCALGVAPGTSLLCFGMGTATAPGVGSWGVFGVRMQGRGRNPAAGWAGGAGRLPVSAGAGGAQAVPQAAVLPPPLLALLGPALAL